MHPNPYGAIVGMGQLKPPGGGGGNGGGGAIIGKGAVYRTRASGLPQRRRRLPYLGELEAAPRTMELEHLPTYTRPLSAGELANLPRVPAGTLDLQQLAGLGQLTDEEIDRLDREIDNLIRSSGADPSAPGRWAPSRLCEIPEGCEAIAVPVPELGARMSSILNVPTTTKPPDWTLEEWAGYVGLQWVVVEMNLHSYAQELDALIDKMQDARTYCGTPAGDLAYRDAIDAAHMRLSLYRCQLGTFQQLRCGKTVLVLEADTGRRYWADREELERAIGAPSEIHQFDYSGLGLDPVTWIIVGGIFVVLSLGAIATIVSFHEIYGAKNADAANRSNLTAAYSDAATAAEAASLAARAHGDTQTADALQDHANSIRREAADFALQGEAGRGASEEREAQAEAGTSIKEILMWGLVALFVLKGMERL
jgi:hypothetical protein